MKKITVSLAALTLSLLLFAGCSKSTDGGINVSFSLVGDSAHGPDAHSAYETWIDKADFKAQEGDDALAIISGAMKEAGYSFEDESYIYSVTTPDGFTLEAGGNSGWMFAVNGKVADVAMTDYYPAAGDHIELRYVDDFNMDVDWETNTFID